MFTIGLLGFNSPVSDHHHLNSGLFQQCVCHDYNEAEGFWHPITDDIKFLLARAGGQNSVFSKALEAKIRPHRRQIDNEDMDTALANTIMVEVFATTVIKDWVGVTDDEGKDLPCNKKNIIHILTELPDLFNELRDVATKHANFRAHSTEEDLGNS